MKCFCQQVLSDETQDALCAWAWIQTDLMRLRDAPLLPTEILRVDREEEVEPIYYPRKVLQPLLLQADWWMQGVCKMKLKPFFPWTESLWKSEENFNKHYTKNKPDACPCRVFVCLFGMGPGSWNPVMGHPIFQGFSLKPKRLALVTPPSRFYRLTSNLGMGREKQTNS